MGEFESNDFPSLMHLFREYHTENITTCRTIEEALTQRIRLIEEQLSKDK